MTDVFSCSSYNVNLQQQNALKSSEDG